METDKEVDYELISIMACISDKMYVDKKQRTITISPHLEEALRRRCNHNRNMITATSDLVPRQGSI